jgi:hypothetical protein
MSSLQEQPHSDKLPPSNLTRLLASSDAVVRREAAQQLRRAGFNTTEVLEALFAAAQDEDKLVRIYSIEALGSSGAVGIPYLEQVLIRKAQQSSEAQGLYREYYDYDGDVSSAFVKIGDAVAVRALLDHREPYVVQTAAHALGRLEDTEGMPDLVRLLHHSSGLVAGQAMIALEQITRAHKDAPSLLAPFKQQLLSALETGPETVRDFGLRLVPFIEANKTKRTQTYCARLSDPEDNIRGSLAEVSRNSAVPQNRRCQY